MSQTFRKKDKIQLNEEREMERRGCDWYVESRELHKTRKNMISWCSNQAATYFGSRASDNQNPIRVSMYFRLMG